ncbi:FtsK/SpoIIIE domain-containing protein [Protaetiibacter intestinalis]|uniref:FtsK domain-containing protein n=1 Tax=Protaetiibacter intestinalis TaxID=2419774 RepID=A0A387BCK3_9MICO|nr:FtsK/SpoIIIE domain-containing protein [Protaetiibacter intestinalis]AYF98836.1 hypothetical protein D7I47_11615 [Protaetiibacter intestinalis]
MSHDTERIPLPGIPAAPPRSGFPLVASLAPLAMAVVLWVMTSSPYALLFGLLGPVVALASAMDARRTARRARRRDVAEALRRLAELEHRLADRAATRRRVLEAEGPPLGARVAGEEEPGSLRVRLGTGGLPSGIEFVPEGDVEAPELAEAVSRVRSRGSVVDGAPVLLGEVELVALGPSPLVAAFARALVLQAAAGCRPEDAIVVVPEGEPWARLLPHPVETGEAWEVRSDGRRLLRISTRHEEGAARPVVVRLGDAAGSPPRVESGGGSIAFRPALCCRAEARSSAVALADRARRRGWRSDTALPERVPLAPLLAAPAPEGGLSAAFARDADGPVVVDLDADGPHAIIAGTTGSGKSELLVSWVLALAAHHPPGELGFLLVDFKGGAAFAPLAELPHVRGIVSDLDAATATRAVSSLRAELQRRERELARAGARAIAELPPGSLARLVIVVDEFAALVALDPELQGVFSDLAARGRSLGLHLVLGTQRPAGVVRDAVLANITLRICLRVLDAGDSEALMGTRAAAALPAEARGRALLGMGGRARPVQTALSTPRDAAALRERWAGHPVPAERPWLDPLPAELPESALPARGGAGTEAVIGLVDRPAEQRRVPLAVDPWTGGLLVVGAGGAGRTTALAMLARVTDAAVRWVPDDPAELWQALVAEPDGRTLVIADDLDRTLAIADPEQRAELGELLVRTVRDARRTGLGLAASARAVGGALHAVQSAFEHRLLLRLPSREEHLLAGGELGGHRADRRPGGAVWRGSEAQLAVPGGPVPAPWRASLRDARLGVGEWAVVSPHPARLIAAWTARGVDAGPAGAVPRPAVVVGDVDDWLADYAALGAVRREGRMLLLGCTAADHRALTRLRTPLPPLGRADGEAWLVEGGETGRVRVVP